MNLLDLFIQYLLSQKKQASKTTIKNYKADVSQFMSWFSSHFQTDFNPQAITPQILDLYKESKAISSRSFERHLSSLRKFFQFLKLEGHVSSSPFEQATVSAQALAAKTDPFRLKDFKDYLYVYNSSSLTIKNYVMDVKQFLKWAQEVSGVEKAWEVKDKNLFSKLDSAVVEEYKKRLLEANLSPLSINRKLSSLRRYLSWAESEGLVSSMKYQVSSIAKEKETPTQQIQEQIPDTKYEMPNTYSSFPPLRLAQKSFKGLNWVFDFAVVNSIATVLESAGEFVWKLKGRPVFIENQKLEVKSQNIPKIPNLPKSFYAPLAMSTKYMPFHQKTWFYLRHKRPNWYRKYHSYPLVHYFHFAILMVFMSAVGFGLYQNFVKAPQGNNLFASSPAQPHRILSFQ